MGQIPNYTEDHFKLVSRIKRSICYYDVLGLKKDSCFEEIKNSYMDLSKKVHPDNNKAPGSDAAFKKVCQAFKCLSNEDSRRHYDCRREKICLGCLSVIGIVILMISIVFIYSSYGISPYSVVVNEYEVPMKTNEYGIEFYVKSVHKFEEKYPFGTPARAQIEKNIIKDYKDLLEDYCDYEKRRHLDRPAFQTPPICEKLESLKMY